MLLRYLELNNFLSHEHERISFPQEGLFLLAGESGSGKSSMIVDAVAYALFGPAATRARKQAELLHEDHPGQPLSVKAMFDFAEGERLIVERGYDSKGSTFAKVYAPNPDDPDNATLLAEGAQPVARFLSKRLGGMNWQQFYAAFVARQSEISNLTTLKGADRKKLIHRMLGMRELEKAAELISGRLRRAKAEVEQLQRQVGGGFDLKEARAKLQEATERVEAEQERLSEAQSELAVKRAELEEAEEALRPLQEAVEAAQELERRSAAIEAQESKVAQLRERVERHEEAQKVVVAELEIKAEHDEAAATRDELRDTYARSTKHQERRDELAALLERQSELRLKVDLPVSTPVAVGAGGDVDNDQDAGEQGQELTAEAARSRREVLRANVKRRAEEIAERSEQLERLRESGECYACQRPFSSEHDHDQVMRGLEAALEELRAEQKADEEEGKRIAANLPTLEEIEKLAEEERSLRRSIAELEADGAVREDLEALAGEGKEAKARVEELAEKLAAIGAAKRDLAPEAKSELEEAERALDEARAGARDLQQKAADESDVEKHRQLSEQVTELKGAVAAMQAQVPERERAREEAKRELAGLEREFEGRKADLENLERMRHEQLLIERVASYLRGYQRHLAGEIRPALTEIGSEMLAQISNGRHVAMHIDDDYEISVETSRGAIKKASMLSGGEEIRANICLRLALTRLVSQRTGVPVGFLIFDEPLPSQDPGHIERILELLESLRPFYRQQFIISHVGDLRSADEMNYVLEFTASEGRERVQLVNA